MTAELCVTRIMEGIQSVLNNTLRLIGQRRVHAISRDIADMLQCKQFANATTPQSTRAAHAVPTFYLMLTRERKIIKRAR